MRAHSGMGVGLCLALMMANVAAADVSYTDGAFSGWGLLPINLNNGSGSAFQQFTGGNPGGWIRVGTSLPPAPANEVAGVVLVNAVNTMDFTYDPTVDGAIGTLDFGIDVLERTSFPIGPGEMAFTVLLIQDATLYVGELTATGVFDSFEIPAGAPLPSASSWVTKQYPGLREEDFSELTAAPPSGLFTSIEAQLIDPNSHPDFSSSGGPIGIGFVASDETLVGGGARSLTGMFDNFSIDFVPEPGPRLASVGALLCLGILHGLQSRRASARRRRVDGFEGH